MISEKELCDKFIGEVRNRGWSCFPEYEGFDLVINKHLITVGVQAKLELNVKVISQILNNPNRNKVSFNLVLINGKSDNSDYWAICHELKIPILWYNEEMDEFSFMKTIYKNPFHFLNKNSYLKLPDDEYKAEAGVRSPLTYSDTKIALCKLEFNCESKTKISIKEIREAGIDIRKIPKNFLKYEKGGFYRFTKLPSVQYPHIYTGLKQ